MEKHDDEHNIEIFKINIITKYISIWGWQIISIIFVCTSIILISLPKNPFSLVLFILCIGMAMASSVNSLSKKRNLKNE